MRPHSLMLVAGGVLTTACGIDRPTTVGIPTDLSPSFSAVKFWDAGATVAWNERATALAAVLADAFPSERDRLEGVAIEASLSRLYAGIHYRFDMEAGLALGRASAAIALAANIDGSLLP